MIGRIGAKPGRHNLSRRGHLALGSWSPVFKDHRSRRRYSGGSPEAVPSKIFAAVRRTKRLRITRSTGPGFACQTEGNLLGRNPAT
jgi:hypothetical protein